LDDLEDHAAAIRSAEGYVFAARLLECRNQRQDPPEAWAGRGSEAGISSHASSEKGSLVKGEEEKEVEEEKANAEEEAEEEAEKEEEAEVEEEEEEEEAAAFPLLVFPKTRRTTAEIILEASVTKYRLGVTKYRRSVTKYRINITRRSSSRPVRLPKRRIPEEENDEALHLTLSNAI